MSPITPPNVLIVAPTDEGTYFANIPEKSFIVGVVLVNALPNMSAVPFTAAPAASALAFRPFSQAAPVVPFPLLSAVPVPDVPGVAFAPVSLLIDETNCCNVASLAAPSTVITLPPGNPEILIAIYFSTKNCVYKYKTVQYIIFSWSKTTWKIKCRQMLTL